MKRVFYCTDFEGVWPVGTCAIVVADSADLAALLLRGDLKRRGLDQEKDWKPEMIEVDTDISGSIVILDGEY
jgi:hypothetical protein